MKNILLLLVILFSGHFTFAQSTLSLQPDSTNGEDAFVWDFNPNSNYGNFDNLDITAWTHTGIPYISRLFLKFNLSPIPVSSSISSAYLSFYHNSTITNYNGIHSGLNESNIQRITSSWQENLITWNNQPTTTALNQLFLPATTSGTQDFLNIDVTNLVQDMVNDPSNSFGFMMRLQTEIQYRDLLFAACEHADSTLHPKLEINYTEPTAIKFTEQNIFNVSLLPNPITTNSFLVIKTKNTPFQISIFNSNGNRLYQYENYKGEIFPLGKLDFNRGIYLVRIKAPSGENRSLKFAVN